MMKKILQLLTIISISSSISLSVIACNNEPNWNNIPIPPPQIPISVTGFKGIDFQSMNIKDYDTVASLFKTIKLKFVNSSWQKDNATTWTGTKDGKSIDLKNTDLRRNAQYMFEIKSNIDLPGDAKFIITITSSHHIADNMSVTNLGIIDDNKPKTILIACVFKNMNLVSKINEIADEYLNHMEIKNGTATLNSTAKGYFFGSVTVNFIVKNKPNPPTKYELKSVIKTPNLGIIPDNRQYTILMYVIIKNFVTQLDSLAQIINNLKIINPTETSALLSATDGSKYFSGSVELKFQIQK